MSVSFFNFSITLQTNNRNSQDAPVEFIKRVGFRLYFEHSSTRRFAEFPSVDSVGWLGLTPYAEV